MPKSPDAFRTISEVADWLGIQAHVLRFWESKFTQVKPIKRAGGRRYYRPADMLLLGGIKKLLHDDGLTIKGVQKLLREEGMSHVSAMSMPLEDAEGEFEVDSIPQPEAVVLPFEAPKDATKETKSVPSSEVESEQEPIKDAPEAETIAPLEDIIAETGNDAVNTTLPEQSISEELAPKPEAVEAKAEDVMPKAPQEAQKPDSPSDTSSQIEPTEPQTTPQTESGAEKIEPVEVIPEADTPETLDKIAPEVVEQDVPADQSPEDPVNVTETDAPAETESESPDRVTADSVTADSVTASLPDNEINDPAAGPAPEATPPLPSFLRPSSEPEVAEVAEVAVTGTETPKESTKSSEKPEPIVTKVTPEPETTPAPKARDIGMPEITPEPDIPAQAAMLTKASRLRNIDTVTAKNIQPLVTQLTAVRDRMAALRSGTWPKS